MAVNEMKKLSCVVLKSEADKLMKSLQKLASVEISEVFSENEDVHLCDTVSQSADLTAKISQTARAIEFLQKYDRQKHSLFDITPIAKTEDFDSGYDTIIFASVKNAGELSVQLSQLNSKATDISAQIEALKPWVSLKATLPEHLTSYTVSVSGVIAQTTDLEALSENLAATSAVISEISEASATATNITVTCLREEYDTVKKILSSKGFTRTAVSANEKEGFAKGKINSLKSELSATKGKLMAAEKNAVALAEKLSDIKAYYDVLTSRLERLSAKSKSADTEKTVIISGWVAKKDMAEVSKTLDSFSAAYDFSDPEEDDDVPVSLSNNAFAENYEPVLAMFSMPKYGTFDPTMIMSLFYSVIFGLMFADVGYGAILLVGCILGLKLLHPAEGLKRMMKMFAVCAVSCIIGGILFGGYFGDLPVAIKENFLGKTDVKSPALAFDMIENPMSFLIVSLVIGAVHLISGMMIKFCVLVKEGHLFDAIFDIGSWLILFAGIGLIFINSTVGAVVSVIGALMLVLTQGRQEKNIFMKFAKGLLSLYDIVSYASDLLSYSRILALGLASAVIASVVNLLATMGGLNFGGIILFIFVFLVGHVINFLVNILGTYVHTSRLQYIEFFGKFFESGGREFSPLKNKTKYVNLK